MIETLTKKKIRASQIYSRLKEGYPNSKHSLYYTTPHELLVATILSAQCIDGIVNTVTKNLFKKYHSLQDFAHCNLNSLSEDIHPCTDHNQKSKNIKATALIIVEEHRGVVPSNLNDLIALPGVERETANCILGEIYNIPSIAVNTHMVRIMSLLGFTRSKDPRKIEFEIMRIYKEKVWVKLTNIIINHGVSICVEGSPKCEACIISELCPSSNV